MEPGEAGAVADWAREGDTDGWEIVRPYDSLDHARRLHAKFVYAGYLRDGYASNGWLYLGSGNLSRRGILSHGGMREGNVESGVVFEVAERFGPEDLERCLFWTQEHAGRASFPETLIATWRAHRLDVFAHLREPELRSPHLIDEQRARYFEVIDGAARAWGPNAKTRVLCPPAEPTLVARAFAPRISPRPEPVGRIDRKLPPATPLVRPTRSRAWWRIRPRKAVWSRASGSRRTRPLLLARRARLDERIRRLERARRPCSACDARVRRGCTLSIHPLGRDCRDPRVRRGPELGRAHGFERPRARSDATRDRGARILRTGLRARFRSEATTRSPSSQPHSPPAPATDDVSGNRVYAALDEGDSFRPVRGAAARLRVRIRVRR